MSIFRILSANLQSKHPLVPFLDKNRTPAQQSGAALGLILLLALSCSVSTPTQGAPTRTATIEAAQTPTVPLPTGTPTLAPDAIAPATRIAGPAVTDVQFALDVEPTGELIFPATEFIHGVARVYVRFAYQGLGDVAQVETLWYRNANPISSGSLVWDGGDAGVYLIWIEDPHGLARGIWRWELAADGESLGGGTFAVGGAPGYRNEAWGVSFDPPPGWEIQSEQGDVVIFSSSDQLSALALRVVPEAQVLPDVAEAEGIFELDQTAAEVVATETVTMNGEQALLQHVRLVDNEEQPTLLFIVSAFYSESAYSLWVLGPAADEAALKNLMVSTLHSIRFGPEG